MKCKYKIGIVLILTGILVLVGVGLVANKKNSDITKNADVIELKLTDFKHKGEYQFCEIPWGTSLEELKTIVPYSLDEDPGRPPTTDGKAFYISSERNVLKGKGARPVYEFYNDELVGVQLVFSSAENSIELFEPIIMELTELFGMESEKREIESEITRDIIYLWKTNNTSLEIVSERDTYLLIFISCTDV